MIYFLDASAASRLSAVEVPAALARRSREGHVAPAPARTAAARFLRDLGEARVVEPRGRVVDLAGELVWRHGLALTFVCSDANLCNAALAEGVRRLQLAS